MKQLNMYDCMGEASATQDSSVIQDNCVTHNSGATLQHHHNAQAIPTNAKLSSFPASTAENNALATQHEVAKEERCSAQEANVTEIIIAREKADSFQMILPMLNHLNQESRWLAWIDPPIELLKKWRNQSELDTGDIMVIRSDEKRSALELTQKALRAGTCHAAIVWTDNLNSSDFSALEAASAEGNSHGIVLRYR